ncbi:tripartite tricarboxylate transporter substrate binding protein [Paenibacillus sp. FJAT-26967]|uniref:Bug family tripartite tricarboxylate transporter substrate binding protein n=1 Tax=Paenibacillus sp. FJAT-26967 TaxID=1729690 RepID=UPI000838707D|nr:tripartite tricarboxylate transporter substrate binding protein [Paenibacillus sp. FJAT-26967]
MIKKHRMLSLTLIGLLALSLTACGSGESKPSAAGAAGESKYPEKPLVVVAPSGAGGGWDKTARSVAKVLGEAKLVEQPMTVENKPGGGGVVFMAQYATQDKKNDYRLFVNSPPILINNLKKEGNSPYGYKDTTPLAQLTKDYGALVVPADSKYKDLKSVLDALKANPDTVIVAGGSAPGSMDHLVAVLPAYKAGIDPKKVKYVSYDGGGQAMTALLGGNADVIATDASSVGEYVKAGKVKVLAVSAPKRLEGILKDVPTMKEQGLDAEFNIWRGVFGPKEMTADAKAYWETKLKALHESEAWKKELQANSWEADYLGSTEFATFLGKQETLVKDMLTALGMAK